MRTYMDQKYHWPFKRLYRHYEQGTLLSVSLGAEDAFFEPALLVTQLKTAVNTFRDPLETEDASEYRRRFVFNSGKLERLQGV